VPSEIKNIEKPQQFKRSGELQRSTLTSGHKYDYQNEGIPEMMFPKCAYLAQRRLSEQAQGSNQTASFLDTIVHQYRIFKTQISRWPEFANRN